MPNILNSLERLTKKIFVVRRAFEENLLISGFHTTRFYAFYEQTIVLTNDKLKNKKKIRLVSKRLIAECRKQVQEDIADYIKEIKARKEKKRSKK